MHEKLCQRVLSLTLSDKQETILSKDIEKWKNIALSNQVIEQEKAKLAIKNSYEESNYPKLKLFSLAALLQLLR